ncbi:MAG: LLM class F420-dependent oxidoreductase [Acidimicrobiia bacterium]|nr:LLM class F420-dependent oxidoreductase [Acidimicrobiia bacterium]
MKIGLAFANTMSFATAAGIGLLAEHGEAAGIESAWTVEHVVFPDGYESEYPYAEGGRMPARADTPMPDPLIWLSFLAARTSTMRLGTGILILPQRNPVVLAKEVATLDALSGGRVELGIGVGWLQEEFDALGIPWDRRGARTDDYVSAMRALWQADSVSHDGEFASFTNVSSNPKPANGTVPIVIGGHSQAAARRAGRLGDGFFPGKGDLSELIDIVRQTAADHGRDPAAIEVTTGGEQLLGDDPVGGAHELRALGVDRAVVPAFLFMNDPAAAMAEFGERVVAPTADI